MTGEHGLGGEGSPASSARCCMGVLPLRCHFFPFFMRNQKSGILGEILGFKMMVVYSDVLKKYSVILEKHSVTGNIVCNLC